jgi:transporter family protein
VLLAVPLLKERLTALQWSGIGLSLAAIYLFHVSDEAQMISAWLLLAMVPVVLWGVAGLMQKMATNHISGRLSAVWFLLAFLPIAASFLVLDPLPDNTPTRVWFVASLVGFTLALGNLTVLLAYASGGMASVITPLAGLYPLVSIPIAIVVFGERIGWRESLGIVTALAAVVLLSVERREVAVPLAANESGTT